jgi:hypothetical protein
MLDGGHLIVMTHARECVDFLRKALADELAAPGVGTPEA